MENLSSPLGYGRRYPIENDLLQFAFMDLTTMTYSLQTFLLQLILASTAFGLITTYSGHRYGLFAYIAVSALYSAGFALFRRRPASTRHGIAGAVLGLALAFFVGVVPDFCRYVFPGGVEPTFDGDGPLMGLAILPLLAFFYLLTPIVMMGALIGWICSSVVSSQGASTT